jgi:hypothetical protein
MARPARTVSGWLVVGMSLTGLLWTCGCGKRGDPLPPFDNTPQPVADLKLAQRGDAVEIRFAAPRTTVEGERLPVLEIELWRADTDGVDVAEHKRLRVAPGERLVETEPLPPPGTTLRFAARARLRRDLSPFTKVVALTAQEPPAIPHDFEAALRPNGVILSWTPPPLPEWLTAPEPPEAAAPESTASSAARPQTETSDARSPVEPPAPSEVSSAPADARPEQPVVAPAKGEEKAGEVEKGPAIAPKPTPEPFRGGVNVYRRSGLAGYGEPLHPTPISSDEYLDATAPLNAEACYVLRTIVSTDPIVESAPSSELCLEVRDIVAPAPPVGVAVALLDDRLEISWSASGEADLASYRVYRAERGGPAAPVSDLPSGTTVLYESLPAAGEVLIYTVTAIDQAGNESPPSLPAQARLP